MTDSPIYPMTPAGIAAFRRWSDTQRCELRQAGAELDALAAQRGANAAYLGNASDDMHLAHECLLDDARAANLDPSPDGFFRAQAYALALAALERQLIDAERVRLMALPATDPNQ